MHAQKLTCLPNWNWWIREGTIENLFSNPLICSLGVMYTIPTNMFRRIITWISINCSIYYGLHPTIYVVTIVTSTAKFQWIHKTCHKSCIRVKTYDTSCENKVFDVFVTTTRSQLSLCQAQLSAIFSSNKDHVANITVTGSQFKTLAKTLYSSKWCVLFEI